jgi:hypothetical protein
MGKDDLIVLTAVAALGGLMTFAIMGGNKSSAQSSSSATSYSSGVSRATEAPTTIPEKIRAAVAAQHSCTPSPYSDKLKFADSDHTGAVYFLGCGDWLYMAFVNPQEQIKVSRMTHWNGR